MDGYAALAYGEDVFDLQVAQIGLGSNFFL
jgi:hypothetical protein